MKFKTIYVDPPWRFTDKLDPTRTLDYPTMSIDELLDLPVNDIADDNSHLYLWSTPSHIFEALLIMKEWGFTYKTMLIWVKRTKNGLLHFGMGHYFRANYEPLLFGVKGKLKTLTKNTDNVLSARMPDRHSGKPYRMYELIERNSPEPRVELFSRIQRKGWTMLGDGIDGEDIKIAINKQTKRT